MDGMGVPLGSGRATKERDHRSADAILKAPLGDRPAMLAAVGNARVSRLLFAGARTFPITPEKWAMQLLLANSPYTCASVLYECLGSPHEQLRRGAARVLRASPLAPFERTAITDADSHAR